MVVSIHHIHQRTITYSVISDQINTCDLLETLDDYAQSYAAEVLRATVREHVLPERFLLDAFNGLFFHLDSLYDTPVSCLNLGIGIMFIVESRYNG